jgi:hypothetical protein
MFLPAFSEYASSGSSTEFAMRYASRAYSVIRTEAGAWVDYDLAVGDQMLKLFSRAAFAHDFENEGEAVASFQLPGSAFLINTTKPQRMARSSPQGLKICSWTVGPY